MTDCVDTHELQAVPIHSKDSESALEIRGCLNLARKANAGDAAALVSVAHSFLDSGYPDDAIDTLKEAIDIDPDYPQAYMALGAARAAQGKILQAIQAFKMVIALDPASPHPHTALGDCYARRGQWEKALESYTAAAAIRPVYGCALVRQAHVLRHMGRDDDAMAIIRDAKAIAESCAETSHALGLFYQFDAESLPEAIRWFKKCVELDPDYAEAYESLAVAHIMNSDKEGAFECICALAEVDRPRAADLVLAMTAK